MRKLFTIAITTTLLALTSGCMQNLQGDSYSRDEARTVQSVRYAVVEDVRMVVIEGTKSGVGGAAGAVVGGIAGSNVGGGSGSTVGSIAGALAGGMLGGKAEEEATKTQGIELILRYQDNDQIIAVVQAYNPEEVFEPGDAVKVINARGTIRVSQ